MALTSYESVIELVAKLVESVPDTGKVYRVLRNARDEAEFLALFKTKVGNVDQYRGWLVSSPDQGDQGSTAATVRESITVALYGYRGVNKDQSSETEFYALTERIKDVLTSHIRAGDTLGSTQVVVTIPAQIVKRGWDTIAGVKVHHCEIRYVVKLEKGVTWTL